MFEGAFQPPRVIWVIALKQEVTNGGVLELRTQSSDLIPSLFKHQTGRRNNDGTNRADKKAVTVIHCGLVMSN